MKIWNEAGDVWTGTFPGLKRTLSERIEWTPAALIGATRDELAPGMRLWPIGNHVFP